MCKASGPCVLRPTSSLTSLMIRFAPLRPLRPREIYSMIFPAPPPLASAEAPNGGRGGEGVQGKASADAYSRKLVSRHLRADSEQRKTL